MAEKKNLEIDVRHIAKTLVKKWWLILPISLLCAAIMLLYTVLFVPKTYTATTQMVVSNVVDAPNVAIYGMTSSDYIAASGLANAYSEILVNDNSLYEILKETNLDNTYTISQLRSMISASSVNSTNLLEIKVTSQNRQHAQMLSDAATKVLSDYELGPSSARAIYQAPLPQNADSRGAFTKSLIGFLLGAIVTSMFILLLDFKKDTVHTDDWLRETYGEKYPVLAVIPVVGGDKSGKHKKYGYYERYGYYSATSSANNNKN